MKKSPHPIEYRISRVIQTMRSLIRSAWSKQKITGLKNLFYPDPADHGVFKSLLEHEVHANAIHGAARDSLYMPQLCESQLLQRHHQWLKVAVHVHEPLAKGLLPRTTAATEQPKAFLKPGLMFGSVAAPSAALSGPNVGTSVAKRQRKAPETFGSVRIGEPLDGPAVLLAETLARRLGSPAPRVVPAAGN